MNNTKRTPRRWLTTRTTSLATLAFVAALTGCAGDPAVYGEGAPLLGPDTAPLPIAAGAAADRIDMAPDCAGRLGNVSGLQLRFEVASLSAGLVVVVDGAGGVVCVDSVSDVESDLNESGQTAEADAVVAGFQAAAHAADGRDARFGGRPVQGDPEPQPNTQPTTLPDPEPQPN